MQVVAPAPSNAVDEEQRAAVLAAEERRYEELKAELQAWATGLTAACLAITYIFYGRWAGWVQQQVDRLGNGGAGSGRGRWRRLCCRLDSLPWLRIMRCPGCSSVYCWWACEYCWWARAYC